MGSEGLHEPLEMLDEATLDYHRAMTSLCEEFEAVDWYNQRATATNDESLATVLAHNRDEEKEHAIMLLEWLRRHDAVIDKNLRTYLFTTLPITEVERQAMGANTSSSPTSSGSLGLGSLRGSDA